jgi:hypothetical protein
MAIKRNPYPILENDFGDFANHNFDARLLSAEIKDGVFYFHFKAEFNEPVLLDYMNQKKVLFCVKAEAKPFFSKIFRSDNILDEVKFELNYKDTPAAFSFTFIPMLISADNLMYENENADAPLNKYSFYIQKNQTLARSKIALSFEVGYKEHSSGALIKIRKLKEGDKPSCGDYDIRLDDPNYIIVSLEMENYKKLISLNAGHQKVLDNLITIPVIQYALFDYLKNPTDYEDNTRDWFTSLDEKHNIREDIKDSISVLKKCNEILDNPLMPFIDHFQRKYLED